MVQNKRKCSLNKTFINLNRSAKDADWMLVVENHNKCMFRFQYSFCSVNSVLSMDQDLKFHPRSKKNQAQNKTKTGEEMEIHTHDLLSRALLGIFPYATFFNSFTLGYWNKLQCYFSYWISFLLGGGVENFYVKCWAVLWNVGKSANNGFQIQSLTITVPVGERRTQRCTMEW